MRDSFKNAFRLAAAIVSIVVLAVLVRQGWRELQNAWFTHRRIDWWWILAAIFFQGCVYFSIAAIFKISLNAKPGKASYPFLVYCAFAFLFANRSMPGPAIFGLATLVYLLRTKQIQMADAQATGASFYFADYAGFITLIAAVSVPLFIEQPNHTIRTASIIGLFAIVVLAGVAVYTVWHPRLLSALIGQVGRLGEILRGSSRDKPNWATAGQKAVMAVRSSILSAAATPRPLFAIYGLSIAMHGCEVATVVCGARAAAIAVGYPVAAASYVAGNLASIVSVLPGALGFFEAGMIGTLHIAGRLGIGDATLVTLIYRALSFWAPIPVVADLLLRVFKQGMSSLVAPKSVT